MQKIECKIKSYFNYPEKNGKSLVCDIHGANAYYAVGDANKNITEYLDSTGTIQAHYEYSPFGKITVSNGSMADDFDYRFSSEVFDTETGLVYYNYRYYSPELGRWLNRDPIGEKGGYNIYGFVFNTPVNLIDIRGKSATLVILGGWGLYELGVATIAVGSAIIIWANSDAIADAINNSIPTSANSTDSGTSFANGVDSDSVARIQAAIAGIESQMEGKNQKDPGWNKLWKQLKKLKKNLKDALTRKRKDKTSPCGDGKPPPCSGRK